MVNHEGPANSFIKTAPTTQLLGRVEKQRPDTFFINTQDRWLTTTGAEKGEMYKLGLEIGNSLKQQKAKGLMGDSTLKFDEKLVKQGLVNELNSFKEGMTAQEAQAYIQKTMMKIQQEKMKNQMPPQGQPAPQGQPVPQEAPQGQPAK